MYSLSAKLSMFNKFIELSQQIIIDENIEEPWLAMLLELVNFKKIKLKVKYFSFIPLEVEVGLEAELETGGRVDATCDLTQM